MGIFHLSTFLKSHIYRQNYQHYCHISTKLSTIICSFLYSYFMILKEVHCWKKHSPYAWLLLTRFEKSDLKWKFWSKNSPNFRKLDQKLDQNGRGSNLLTGNSLHKNKITVFWFTLNIKHFDVLALFYMNVVYRNYLMWMPNMFTILRQIGRQQSI